MFREEVIIGLLYIYQPLFYITDWEQLTVSIVGHSLSYILYDDS